MSLDGLRAWIGEVERKLGMRTRVFLVLVTIAIGGAGAAIYLALDTRDNAVSESDVQELQQQLEAQAGGTTGGAGLAQLEAELKTLEAEVERLGGDGGASKQDGSAGGNSGGASEGAGGASGDEGTRAKLRELLEQAKEQNEKAEQAK